MVGISKTSQFLAVLMTVVVALCVFPTATGVVRLASEVGGEGKKVCGGVVPLWCPVKCFRAEPVCGVDGVTYWCGCSEAACEGAEVAKLGFCEVGSGGSVPLSGQALLLVHIVWLIVLAFSVIFGLF